MNIILKGSSSTPKIFNSNLNSFLKTAPSGAYSVARTFNGGKEAYMFDMHISRTVKSFQDIHKNLGIDLSQEPWSSNELVSTFSDTNKYSKFVLSRLKMAIDFAQNELSKSTDSNLSNEDLNADWKFLVHISSKELVHTLILTKTTPIPPKPVTIELASVGPRTHATVKDSTWVSERDWIEKKMEASSNEVLLSEVSGDIGEGLSSNFAVLTKSGQLQTAPSNIVLGGTVLKAILEIATKQLSIPILYKCPNIHEAKDNWNSAFVCSTSRQLLPISKILDIESKKPIIDWEASLSPESAPILFKLKQALIEQRSAFSTKIE